MVLTDDLAKKAVRSMARKDTQQSASCLQNTRATRVIHRLQSVMAVVLAVSVITGTALIEAHAASTKRSHTIKDSGLLARSMRERDIHWLDNEQVLFIGYKEGERRLEGDHEAAKFDLFVWNTSSGQVHRHWELSTYASLCLANGYVRYEFDREGRRYARRGQFGSEQEVEVDVEKMREGSLAVSPVSCREFNPKALEGRYGRNALPLLEVDEYLDRANPSLTDPLRYFPASSDAGIRLSISPRVVGSVPDYSEYARKYVFNEIRYIVSLDTAAAVWLLDRSGAVHRTSLPQGLWLAGVVKAMPIHDGWVMTSTATPVARRVDAAGVYHVAEGTAVRVIRGLPHAFSVSASGCKVAVAIDRELKQRTRAVIQMIDFCGRGN